jgi:hypothetical protein
MRWKILCNQKNIISGKKRFEALVLKTTAEINLFLVN